MMLIVQKEGHQENRTMGREVVLLHPKDVLQAPRSGKLEAPEGT